MAGREGGRTEKEKEKRLGGDSPKHTVQKFSLMNFFENGIYNFMSKFSSHSTLVMERIARIPGGCLEGEVGQLRIEKEFLEWKKSSPPLSATFATFLALGSPE